MTIGDKIRLLRKENKVSIRKLSEMTGLSKSTLSDLENNKSKKPTVDTIDRIAKALQIPICKIFEEIQNENKQSKSTQEKDTDNKNLSQAFLSSIDRAKESPKEVQDKIASFIDLILEQEGPDE